MGPTLINEDLFSMSFNPQSTIDDYAKDGGPVVVLHVIFTLILCGTNFSILHDMDLIFTGYLQIASQRLYLISRQYNLK